MDIFLRRQTSRVTEKDRLILKLRHQRDTIQQYQQRVELNIDQEEQLVKRLEQDGQQEAVLQHMNKIQNYNQKLQRSDRIQEKLERMISQLELSQIQEQTEEVMREATECMQQLNEMVGEGSNSVEERANGNNVGSGILPTGLFTFRNLVIFGFVALVGFAILAHLK